VKQFPGKKQKISLLLRAKKEKMVVLSFIPEPKSIAYRNYLIELLQSTEVPRILRDQEIHIFL
jgi:hypothetical protein